MTWRAENKYSRWYDALIEKARRRQHLQKPYEQHHVWPIALGGDRKSETVRLTWKEHFLAHWLLTKCATTARGRDKMRYALEQMCWINGTNDARIVVSSWRFAIARKFKLEAIANREPRKHTEEFKRALSLRNKGNKYGKGQKKGFKHSPETLAKISETSQKAWAAGRFDNRPPNTKGNPGYRHTEETKRAHSIKHKNWWSTVDPERLATRNKKIGDKLRGRTYTEDTISKMSAAAKRRWSQMSEQERRDFGNKRRNRIDTEETRIHKSTAAKKLWASQEYRRKMSEAQTGRTHSEETRGRIGAAHRGKIVSSETRAKISAARKGRLSEETLAKMRAAQQKRWQR